MLEIALAARSGPARLGASRLITIDGPAGSGKTTLARRLEFELGETGGNRVTAGGDVVRGTGGNHTAGRPGGNGETRETAENDGPVGRQENAPARKRAGGPGDVAAIHLDDLYEGWTGLNSRLFNRLDAWVIVPLANSLAARFLVYDWDRARFTRWAEVLPARYVIIEGVGAGDVVTREWATTKVWLDVSDETGRRRGLARDTASQRESLTDPGIHEHWSAWQEAQAVYLATASNRAAADFCVDTTQL